MSIIETIAGNGNQGYSGDGGKAVNAEMDNPFHVDIDTNRKYLYFADCFNYRVRRVDLSQGTIENFAGTGMKGHSGDGGAATRAHLHSPYNAALDREGNLFIADTNNKRVRRVDAASDEISTVAGTGEQGFTGDGGPAVAALLG